LGAQEVTPIDAAAAFSIFANGGIRPRPYAVWAIADTQGGLVDRTKPKLTKVLSPQAAYLALDLLRGVVDRGTAGSLRAHGISGDVAGKTGTTNDKRDAWFIGFRPDLLVLVWVGFDDGTETHLTGAQGAVPIWEDFMRSIGADVSDETFDRPEGIVTASIDTTTGGLASPRCRETVEEIFIEGRLPPDCPEHAEGLFKKFWHGIFGKGHRDTGSGGKRYDRD
jgi:membrane carboxypeptidase/penicillin-binding protein